MNENVAIDLVLKALKNQVGSIEATLVGCAAVATRESVPQFAALGNQRNTLLETIGLIRDAVADPSAFANRHFGGRPGDN